MPCLGRGEPLYSPEGALLSTKKILDVTGLSPTEIDVFEWNEAFAVISALFGREYPNLIDRYKYAWWCTSPMGIRMVVLVLCF